MNDNAIQFYSTEQTTTAPIFSIYDQSRPDEIVAGSTRKNKDAPVVFVIFYSVNASQRSYLASSSVESF